MQHQVEAVSADALALFVDHHAPPTEQDDIMEAGFHQMMLLSLHAQAPPLHLQLNLREWIKVSEDRDPCDSLTKRMLLFFWCAPPPRAYLSNPRTPHHHPLLSRQCVEEGTLTHVPGMTQQRMYTDACRAAGPPKPPSPATPRRTLPPPHNRRILAPSTTPAPPPPPPRPLHSPPAPLLNMVNILVHRQSGRCAARHKPSTYPPPRASRARPRLTA
jgi:hypothetical protein